VSLSARRQLAGGYELDDDRGRIDVREVRRYLSEDSYWASGRSLEAVERAVRYSARGVGLYLEGRQVGFCRVVSDGVAMAYLADVYVLPEQRGRGLGAEMVREAVENGPHAGLKWLLHTRDAHSLYARFGFGPPWSSSDRPGPPRRARRSTSP